MNRCMIVDDEPAAHYVLANYIAKTSQLELAGQCYNALDAMDFLRENEVDLIFLDIDMPEVNGLEFMALLQNPPKIILTTAHSEFALQSYEFGVVDYLLKPIAWPRFLKAVDRFLSFGSSAKEQIPTFFTYKVDGRNIDVKVGDIKYFQSYGNYVKIFTKSRTLLITSTTQELLVQLPASLFIRVHKSFIIALHKVEDFRNGQVTIDGEVIPVGITYKRELQERLMALLPGL